MINELLLCCICLETNENNSSLWRYNFIKSNVYGNTPVHGKCTNEIILKRIENSKGRINGLNMLSRTSDYWYKHGFSGYLILHYAHV